MCSVLTVIATFIISFILACDLVDFAPIELIDTSCCNGHCITEEGSAQKAFIGTAQLVSTSKRDPTFAAPKDQTRQVAAPTTSFTRSYIHCSDLFSNDRLWHGALEVLAMQENLLRKTRVLCAVWPTMEILSRPRVCAASTQDITEAGSVASESLGGARQLECRTVDSIPKKETVSKKKIQSPCSQKQGRQGQRQGKGLGRAAALWASALS